MRRSTGLALATIGAIGLLAVHAPLTFVSPGFTGLILMITGLTARVAGRRLPATAAAGLSGVISRGQERQVLIYLRFV